MIDLLNWRSFLSILKKSIITSGRLSAFFVLLALIWLRVEDPEFLKLIRAKTFDFYQQIKPRSTENIKSPVIILDIEEKSLEKVGQWPWRRTIMAELVDKLHKAKSAAVGFDFVMPEKDGTSLPELVTVIVSARKGKTDLIFGNVIGSNIFNIVFIYIYCVLDWSKILF